MHIEIAVGEDGLAAAAHSIKAVGGGFGAAGAAATTFGAWGFAGLARGLFNACSSSPRVDTESPFMRNWIFFRAGFEGFSDAVAWNDFRRLIGSGAALHIIPRIMRNFEFGEKKRKESSFSVVSTSANTLLAERTEAVDSDEDSLTTISLTGVAALISSSSAFICSARDSVDFSS